MTPKEAIEHIGLEIKSEFIPFSYSRNKDDKSPSLNWKITLLRKGREVLITDYMAGCGHCPSYKKGLINEAVELECQTGRKSRYVAHTVVSTSEKINPDIVNVIYCLVSDGDVLDYSSFEEWAQNFGYDTDSRKAEATYRACLETALKLRSGIGEEGIRALKETFQDY